MSSTTIYAATSNPGKLRDFAFAAEGHLLHHQSIQIEPLPNLAQIPAPPEDAPTFEGNARTKALYYAAHAPGLYVLADDSGLEVDALHGTPGVRSARYAEDLAFPPLSPNQSPDQRNNDALLHALTGIPTPRTARYRCILALARNSQVLTTAHGALEGEILLTPRGTLGFGYDPIFLIPSLNLTMAQLDPATRLAHSHRGRALKSLLETLST